MSITGFIAAYMSPTALYDRIRALAADFPHLAELVRLPENSIGYRRPAQGVLGGTDASRIAIESKSAGHEFGNGLSVVTTSSGFPHSPLSVAVFGSIVTVGLATDGTGSVSSTAAQVVAALNANPATAAALTAYTFRGNAGAGIVAPGSVVLTDGLSAPPAVSRGASAVYALRIGKVRDGSKPGVLLYAQEHGNEWVPPLVAIETAERLLRNYALDPTTFSLVNDLDLFVVPSVNPDGGHYSFYDHAPQRKNMARHCPLSGAADFLARNTWGVDIGRNYSTGSVFDGFTGASTDCTSDTFAGPNEFSEPESRNLDWIASTYRNIDYAIDLQSPGPLIAWSPGASTPAGVSLPRPSAEEDAVFRRASARIVAGVQSYRGTVIPSTAIGPIVDVLGSAAGNSTDDLWYKHGIRALALGIGTETQPVFYNPNSSAPSAHAESQEFAGGVLEFLRFVRARQLDKTAPTVALNPTPASGTFDGNAHSLVLKADDADSGLYVVSGEIYKAGAVYASTQADAGGAASFTHAIDLATVVSGGLPLGAYELRYSARDIAGNSSPTHVFPFTIADATKPTVTLVSPAGAGPFKKLSLKVRATDNHGVKQIVAKIYRNGVLVKTTQSPGGGAKTATHTATVALPEGKYTLKYHATDLRGLVSQTRTFTFKIDKTSPTVTVKTGQRYTVRSGGKYTRVSFRLYDLGKVARVTLNGVAKNLTDKVSTSLNFVKPGVYGAVRGVNKLVVYDVAGNKKTVTFTLK